METPTHDATNAAILRAAADLPHSPEEPLDRQEIPIRVVVREAEDKRPVSAAEIDLEWRSSCE